MSNSDSQNGKLIFENEIIGLSNRIDERFHNNMAFYLNNCCPECGTVLDKKIKDTQQCPECKKSILFKQNIHNYNNFLITFDDLKEFNKLEEQLEEIYLYEEQMQELNKRYPEYMYYFWNLKKEKPNLSIRDFVWGFEIWLFNTLDVKYVNSYKEHLKLKGKAKIEACDKDVAELQKASLVSKYMMDIAIYKGQDDPAEELLLTLMYRNITLAHLYYLHCEERHVDELKFYMDSSFAIEYVSDYLHVYQCSLSDLKEKFFLRARGIFMLDVVTKEDAWNTFCDVYNWYLNHRKNDTVDENENFEPNPHLAEVLMFDYRPGGELSEEDYAMCQKICDENKNDRSEILKVIVKLCGNIDTPKMRYIKALAWSYNRVEYSEQRIEAINNYLNHTLYTPAYSNYGVSIDKGINYGKRLHIETMLQYMADAYCHLKDYENEEKTYLKIYNLKLITPNGCVKLARYYSKRGQREKAINILKNEKRKLKYILHEEYRRPIDEYLTELEKKQKGISKHFFSGYDSWPGPFLGPIDNPVYHPELEEKYNKIKEKYKSTFEYHREFLEKIDYYEARIKENSDDADSKEQFNTYCLSDINLYPKILNYYKEYNTIGFANRMEYSDNRNSDYPIFKKLILFYEKEKRYEEAIKLCDIAIDYGVKKYLGKITMEEKKEKLKEKAK
ncbi:MAG: hypothetical protein IKE90_02100 [Bacilli bacterium]|nr:hypothetical protein [Bacilli bacterium]